MRKLSLSKKIVMKKLMQLYKSIWFFPTVAFLVMIILVSLKISGSSVGVYNQIYYGANYDDPNLILNKPRMIRSDEWLTNTQMTIAQDSAGNPRINNSIGDGQDMTVVLDVPTKDWSTLFKPHNWAFFVLSVEYAFALKWWLLSYLLLMSCYFFVLKLLPGKRLIAALIAVSLLFSAFIQWWYQYITLAPIYYALFILITFMSFFDKNSRKSIFLKLILQSYLLTSFALILYPPFQIPVAIVTAAFALGYALDSKHPRKKVFRLVLLQLIPIFVTVIAMAVFFTTRSSVISTIQNTAYPGERNILSGGYDLPHLLSGNLAFLFQFTSRSNNYVILEKGIYNQSETSTFFPLYILLLIPSLIMIIYDYRHKLRLSRALIAVNIIGLLFIVRLFVPLFDSFYKATYLHTVPHSRLLIGFGLINLFVLTLFIKRLQKGEIKFKKKIPLALLYAFLCLGLLIAIGLQTQHRFPTFMNVPFMLLLSIPLPIFIYLLLKKRVVLALIVLTLFTIGSSAGVHPLYRGLSPVLNSNISNEIKRINSENPGKWATEELFWENYPAMFAANSLSGTYAYPQFGNWEKIKNTEMSTYNRYAHVLFDFDRDKNTTIDTSIKLVGGDNFEVVTEVCSDYAAEMDITYIIVTKELDRSDSCITPIKTVVDGYVTFSIYQYKQ